MDRFSSSFSWSSNGRATATAWHYLLALTSASASLPSVESTTRHTNRAAGTLPSQPQAPQATGPSPVPPRSALSCLDEASSSAALLRAEKRKQSAIASDSQGKRRPLCLAEEALAAFVGQGELVGAKPPPREAEGSPGWRLRLRRLRLRSPQQPSQHRREDRGAAAIPSPLEEPVQGHTSCISRRLVCKNMLAASGACNISSGFKGSKTEHSWRLEANRQRVLSKYWLSAYLPAKQRRSTAQLLRKSCPIAVLFPVTSSQADGNRLNRALPDSSKGISASRRGTASRSCRRPTGAVRIRRSSVQAMPLRKRTSRISKIYVTCPQLRLLRVCPCFPRMRIAAMVGLFLPRKPATRIHAEGLSVGKRASACPAC